MRLLVGLMLGCALGLVVAPTTAHATGSGEYTTGDGGGGDSRSTGAQDSGTSGTGGGTAMSEETEGTTTGVMSGSGDDGDGITSRGCSIGGDAPTPAVLALGLLGLLTLRRRD